jgi:riboflavin transporter FmnP
MISLRDFLGYAGRLGRIFQIQMKEENEMKNKLSPRFIAVIGMFTALAVVSVLATEWIPKVQGFLSYEPKDALIVMAGFIYGPVACVLISLLASLIEMLTFSTTGIYGFIMNVVATMAFTMPAAFIYYKNRTKKNAMIGLGVGVVSMAAVMVLWNYVITPFYMGVSRNVVAGMLASVFLPFNLVKGGINAGLALILYKPLVTALRRTGFAEKTGAEKGKFQFGFLMLSIAILSSFVLWFLVMIKVL